jgi:hypothetical protein
MTVKRLRIAAPIAQGRLVVAMRSERTAPAFVRKRSEQGRA